MNFGMIKNICGQVIRFEAAFMALCMIVAAVYGEFSSLGVFAATIAVMLVISFLLTFKKPADKSFYAKEGLITVSLSWLIISLFGSVPFMLTGTTASFIDSLFETVSGFTTTGASILADVEALDKSILFWRSFTQWIGGMGVLMFVMSILPLSGADPFHVMRAESPGPTKEKLVPKARQTAKILYLIYIGLTVSQTVFLLFGGMPLYDSIVHALSTAGTGGFSIKNASIAAYNSVYIEVVITVFMILYGINFSSYFLLLAKKFKGFFTHEETRVYIGIILVSIVIITINLTGTVYGNIGESLRYSSFQVASMISTTAYVSSDFNVWPTLSKFLILFLMFIGGSAGSTAGGIKVSRFIIMFKTMKREAVRILHPQAVRLIKLDNMPVDEGVIRGTGIFMVIFFGITAVSILLISLNGYDMETSASAVISCINNIGPGLGKVSAAGNYSGFSVFSKIILCLNMFIGRLEVYPVLLLMSPAIWRKRR